MRYKRVLIGIATGIAFGIAAFLLESGLVAVLPPLGGVASWFPNTVLLLVTVATGIICGLTTRLFAPDRGRVVLGVALCAYAIIDFAGRSWWIANVPKDFVTTNDLIAVIGIGLAHIVAFIVGAIGASALIDYLPRRRAGNPGA